MVSWEVGGVVIFTYGGVRGDNVTNFKNSVDEIEM